MRRARKIQRWEVVLGFGGRVDKTMRPALDQLARILDETIHGVFKV